ncbi:unnamed protein product [Aphanomyces euteiches]
MKFLLLSLLPFKARRTNAFLTPSNSFNLVILGQVIEAVTNQTWYDYVRKTIWTPLGMNNTFGRAADTQTPQELSFGDRSTAEDLSKLSHLLLNKGRGIFTSDAIVAGMITGHNVRPVNLQTLPILFGQTFKSDFGAYSAGCGINKPIDTFFHVLNTRGTCFHDASAIRPSLASFLLDSNCPTHISDGLRDN